MSKRLLIPALLFGAMAASPLSSQILGGGGGGGGLGGLGGLGGGAVGQVGQVGNTIGGTVERTLGTATGVSGTPITPSTVAPVSLDRVTQTLEVANANPVTLRDIRRARLQQLIDTNRSTLDRDGDNAPVRRNALVAIDPDPAAVATAQALGFRIVRDERIEDLGLRMVTLALPARTNVREAKKRLSKAVPSLSLDYDHIYEPAGGALAPAASTALAAMRPFPPGTRVAMIDGGVASHASLSRASIEQRGFAGPAQPTGHGTAVASLLVGSQGPFRGAAQGASLFVGDVYGGSPAAGSASVIVRALAWAASKRPSVVNISLVGPRNAVLERAVGALRARGIAIVAAVGNDGPAAPPQYPASYPGVVAVTGVDANNRALNEAGKALHLDFAAPGADLAAASPTGGYVAVRGTSFAAPLAAARVAATGNLAILAGEAVPGKGRIGRGIVCASCRTAPRAIGAK